MNEEKRPIDAGGLVAGLLLIAIGALFLLDRMGYIDFHMTLTEYWPMAIIIFGISRVMRHRSGAWMIIVGVWLQAVTLHLWDMTFESSWPLLLIGIGCVMVVRALMRVANAEVRHDD